ncbi:hypothetical protein BDQ17DRAFT_1370186 [Cyathus striatus]|nr:hypothetical protein BDQ17DRAFT_1370186 [Cyathus striatus]
MASTPSHLCPVLHLPLHHDNNKCAGKSSVNATSSRPPQHLPLSMAPSLNPNSRSLSVNVVADITLSRPLRPPPPQHPSSLLKFCRLSMGLRQSLNESVNARYVLCSPPSHYHHYSCLLSLPPLRRTTIPRHLAAPPPLLQDTIGATLPCPPSSLLPPASCRQRWHV